MKKILLGFFLLLILSGCHRFYPTTDERIFEIEQNIIELVSENEASVLGISKLTLENGLYIESSSGSGVVYKKVNSEYYLVTNQHVILDADKIEVVFEDLSSVEAKLVGKDARTDLAVLTFKSDKNIPLVEFGNSDNLKKGQFVIAMGNPLGLDYYGTVTVGNLSGVSRAISIDYDGDNVIDWVATLIQHDAALSPGNSGGALFDISGKLIGINNMKIIEEYSSGIGFAIPINTVKDIVKRLEADGEIERPSLGIIGNEVTTIIEQNNMINAGLIEGELIEIPNGISYGVYINQIVPNSSAASSDLRAGDIILRFNDVKINNFTDLRHEIEIAYIGDVVELLINRKGSELKISLTLIKSN